MVSRFLFAMTRNHFRGHSLDLALGFNVDNTCVERVAWSAPSPPASLPRGERVEQELCGGRDRFCELSVEVVVVKIQNVTASAFVVAALVLQAVVHTIHGSACCTLPQTGEVLAANESDVSQSPAEKKKAQLTVLSSDLHELKEAFNADQGSTRVLLIVSPRCPACRRGAEIVEKQALSQIKSDHLKVYVVWIRRFPLGDSRDAAQEATRLVPDGRSLHFWDGPGRLGQAYGKVVDLPHKKKFAWDVYFVFDAKAKWGDAPPKPDFWMHQLGGPDTGNMLDGGKFREAILQRLP